VTTDAIVLSDLLAEITLRQLPCGGWAALECSAQPAIETSCYCTLALNSAVSTSRAERAFEFLLQSQNRNGSWPAFEGDDQEGCWTTSLAMIALRFGGSPARPIERGQRWLLNNKGREGHWFWKWKFRTFDRAVQFDPEKNGWPWFPETVSWVIPTAFALIALRQSFHTRIEEVLNRVQIGNDMLRDRACPQGGWNAGNGIVFGSALIPHIDSTAIALLALIDDADPTAVRGCEWLRQATADCASAFSLAWAVVAFLIHHDQAVDACIANLLKVLASKRISTNVETLSLAAIALKAVDGNANPFRLA